MSNEYVLTYTKNNFHLLFIHQGYNIQSKANLYKSDFCVQFHLPARNVKLLLSSSLHQYS